MSQPLPLSPPFPLLDSRPPVQRDRPTDVGERSAQRQAFGRMLDRFAQNDRGPDAPKDSAPAAQDQRPREHRVESSDSSAAPADDTTSDSDTDTTDTTVAPTMPAHAAPADAPKPAPDAAQVPTISAATPVVVVVAANVPVVAAAPTEAAPATAATATPTGPAIAAIPVPVAASAAPKEPEPVAGAPAAAVSKAAAMPAESAAAAAVQEAAPGTLAFGQVTMPTPRPRQVATPANGKTEPAKAAAAAPADKAAAELAAPQAGRFQTARAEADANTAANSNQAQPQFRIVKADANTAADVPALAGTRDDRAAAQSGADQTVASLTALDSPRQTAALYHKVADAAKAGADAPTPADQVSIRLVHAVAEGKRAIQMHLHPAELGSIDVKMQWQGDKLTAQFTVDRPETLQILQREVPALERSLGQAGVNVDSGSLSFSLRQQQGNGKGNGEGFNQAAANAGLGDASEGAGDVPLGQVIRDGILSIRV